MRENYVWKENPMLFLTAWKDKFRDSTDFFGDNHIEKPFDLRDLKERIYTVLR